MTSGMRSSSRWPSRAMTSCAAFSTDADLAVDGARRHAQLAGDVAQRRLGEAVAGDALDGGVEHRVERRGRRTGQPLGQERERDDLGFRGGCTVAKNTVDLCNRATTQDRPPTGDRYGRSTRRTAAPAMSPVARRASATSASVRASSSTASPPGGPRPGRGTRRRPFGSRWRRCDRPLVPQRVVVEAPGAGRGGWR